MSGKPEQAFLFCFYLTAYRDANCSSRRGPAVLRFIPPSHGEGSANNYGLAWLVLSVLRESVVRALVESVFRISSGAFPLLH